MVVDEAVFVEGRRDARGGVGNEIVGVAPRFAGQVKAGAHRRRGAPHERHLVLEDDDRT
jgi:hypothetical protein